MLIAIAGLAAFAAGVVYCSLFEWVLHKYVMHRPILGFRYPFRAHALVHHNVFRADDTYFLSRDEDKKLVAMAWWNAPVILLLNSPVYFAAGMIAGGLFTPLFWAAAAGTAGSMVAYYVTYEFFHWCMHVKRERWFSNSFWFRWIDDHHRMHHKRPTTNLNVVLPLWDILLRTKAPGLPAVYRVVDEARTAAAVR